MALISVIVPVYNTGKYLSQCLDSILTQTFTDFEVICINDGSTDNSDKILADYAKRDKRIRVITQKNSGVVVARNNGIAQARGIYIYPLDGDDIIAPNCLEKLYATITTTKYRVVMSNARTFGRFNDFFHQPKLTKYQMYGWHEQCIISALFYKDDFIKFGGYCTDFNGYSGDDIDYWLNYMDAKLPMIRVPDVLFYYRTKDDAESVWKNYASSERHQRYVYKEKLLRLRHPKVKWWAFVYQLMNTKLGRFIYCVRNNKVKIFKIPVCKNSLGVNYFSETANFGDLLTPYLLNYLYGRATCWENIKTANLLCIGSLLDRLLCPHMSLKQKLKRIFAGVINIWGSGFIMPELPGNVHLKRRVKVYALRGELSRKRMEKYTGQDLSHIALGDPGLLISRVFDTSKISKKYECGIIPHYVDAQSPLLNNIKIKNSIIIDVSAPVEQVLNQIAQCKTIMSSAMHGLIAADAMGIPNVRLVLSDRILGGDYKFTDYYSAFGLPLQQKVILDDKTKITNTDFIRNQYNITPAQVSKICDSLLAAFPYK